jgi:GT2 family glycosyltransferase
MSQPPPVSIIVPHYNDLARLDTCLAAISLQTYPRELVEVVVADNASPCGEAAVVEVIAGRARLTVCAIKGAGPARNAGVAAASHGVLAFTDSDCLVDPGWLAAGVAALDGADLVGGRMKVSVRQPGRRSGAEAFEQVFGFDNRDYVLRQNFTVTANLFTRAKVFAAIGGFRTEVSEDKEWCQRAVAAGHRIAYAPDAVVGHPARADWAELRHKWERLESESLALAAERPGGRLRWVARSWLLPLSIAAHAPKVLRSPELDNFPERLRALGTLARARLWRFANAQRIGWSRR